MLMHKHMWHAVWTWRECHSQFTNSCHSQIHELMSRHVPHSSCSCTKICDMPYGHGACSYTTHTHTHRLRQRTSYVCTCTCDMPHACAPVMSLRDMQICDKTRVRHTCSHTYIWACDSFKRVTRLTHKACVMCVHVHDETCRECHSQFTNSYHSQIHELLSRHLCTCTWWDMSQTRAQVMSLCDMQICDMTRVRHTCSHTGKCVTWVREFDFDMSSWIWLWHEFVSWLGHEFVNLTMTRVRHTWSRTCIWARDSSKCVTWLTHKTWVMCVHVHETCHVVGKCVTWVREFDCDMSSWIDCDTRTCHVVGHVCVHVHETCTHMTHVLCVSRVTHTTHESCVHMDMPCLMHMYTHDTSHTYALHLPQWSVSVVPLCTHTQFRILSFMYVLMYVHARDIRLVDRERPSLHWTLLSPRTTHVTQTHTRRPPTKTHVTQTHSTDLRLVDREGPSFGLCHRPRTGMVKQCYILSKKPNILSKEPFILWKEPYMHQQIFVSSIVLGPPLDFVIGQAQVRSNSATSCRKSPIFCQKSPIFYEKSLVCHSNEKSPVRYRYLSGRSWGALRWTF